MTATNDGCIVVGVEDSELSDAAVEAAFRLGRERGQRVIPVHAADLHPGWWQHVDEEDLARGREATLERLTHRLASAGLDPEDLSQLRVIPGSPTAVLVKEATTEKAALLVVGRHRREGVVDFFGDTVRGCVASAPCPVWVQSGPARPIERVLVGVEPADSTDTETAREAIAVAREQARALGVPLLLLHCFVQPELGAIFGYPVPLPPNLVLKAREEADKAFRSLVASFEWDDRPHETLFVNADPTTEILERATQTDLIVLGSPGGSMLSRALLGSTATAVLRRAEAPVLAFRPSADRD